MDFYDEVLRELLVAIGAALFVGNLVALLRRAPVGRTIAYMAIGLVVAVWGLASLLAS